MPEIHPADPRARRKLVVWISISAIAILFSQKCIGWFTDWLAEDPERVREYFGYIIGAIAIFFSPLLWFGYAAWQLGVVVVVAKRFPAPDMKVIVDTVVVKGRQAILRGRLFQMTGAILWGVAIGFPLIFGQILKDLLSNTP